MNRIILHDAFVPQGCAGQLAPQPAVEIGAGAIWLHVYGKEGMLCLMDLGAHRAAAYYEAKHPTKAVLCDHRPAGVKQRI